MRKVRYNECCSIPTGLIYCLLPTPTSMGTFVGAPAQLPGNSTDVSWHAPKENDLPQVIADQTIHTYQHRDNQIASPLPIETLQTHSPRSAMQAAGGQAMVEGSRYRRGLRGAGRRSVLSTWYAYRHTEKLGVWAD